MKNLLFAALLLVANITTATNPLFLTGNSISNNRTKSVVFKEFEPASNFQFGNNNESQKCGRYQKMKKTGKILLCVGAPLAGVGLTCMIAGGVVTASNLANYNENVGAGVGLYVCGVLLFLPGMGCTGAGVPLYIIGNIKSKKYCGGGTSFQLNQSKQGLGIAYNF